MNSLRFVSLALVKNDVKSQVLEAGEILLVS